MLSTLGGNSKKQWEERSWVSHIAVREECQLKSRVESERSIYGEFEGETFEWRCTVRKRKGLDRSQ